MVNSQENYQNIIKSINESAIEVERKAKDILLIAVTKTFERADIEPILKLGHKFFGESKVQEAYKKWIDIKKDYPDVKLHLIGPLQTNKIKNAVALFDVIETLDREKVAVKIANEIKRTNKKIDLMIQVNTGEEPQKAGVYPKNADAFIKFCIDECKLSIKGLMCLPPFEDESSPHFALLANIAKRNNLPYLSMGMSSDYKSAVRLGATHVRVGTAIFGTR